MGRWRQEEEEREREHREAAAVTAVAEIAVEGAARVVAVCRVLLMGPSRAAVRSV